MKTEFFYKPGDRFARCVHTGSLALPVFIELGKSIRKFSEENGIGRVLLDISAATEELTMMERYILGDQAVDILRFRIRLAIYGKMGQIREDKFGIMVARRRGAQVNAFTDLSEAEGWIVADT